ncbi:hypothetical protein KKH81_00550, partial [Patescibacteria group bacterium]|nr:hypothetical protein [Patescibacteria group bacterium]
LFLVLVVSVPVQAQIVNTDALYLTVTPDYPRPFSTATVTVRSDTIDLYSSTVTITVNGVVVQTGTGVTTGTFVLGGPGTKSSIIAKITTNGFSFSKELVLVPSDVALIMEPVSTAHPFYEGGPLVASEGRLRLVAVPDLRNAAGVALDPKTLVYTWRLGNKVLQTDSGIGRNILTATAPVRYRDAPITVTVTNQDQTLVAEASTLVSPVDPVVRIYRNDPLLGPDYANALLGSANLQGTEDAFRMVPYFFSSLPAITWAVNGTVNETSNVITLRSTGGGAGTAQVTASAQNSATFQSANASLSVRFGETRGLGIFGL